VLQLEVLVTELLAVDGLATSALCTISRQVRTVNGTGLCSYVATGEVTALKHELGDDTVEGRALVAEALLTSAESAEVLGCLGDNVTVEVEVDAAGLGCGECNCQLCLFLDAGQRR
jgi:hypothetical protein